MAKIGSGKVVLGLTLGALAAVATLAVQANGTVTTKATGASAPSPKASSQKPLPPKLPAVPARSGSGKRVVYSLGSRRVWLVDPAKKQQVVRTFTVQPSTVDPLPGTYTVYARVTSGTGSDGVAIEHAVDFIERSGTPIGFSAAVSGATPKPDPSRKTGGIREKRADGLALWDFTEATAGSTAGKIVVVR